MFVLFFFWLLCGIVAAVVASNKGRNVFGWLMIGFLLGPFGMILSLVVASHQGINTSQLRKCPACAEFVQREAVKCRYCSSELPPMAPDEDTRIACPGCGTRINHWVKDKRCYLCKTPLPGRA